MAEKKFAPRVKLILEPGRMARFWPRVCWMSEQFDSEFMRGNEEDGIDYCSVAEAEAIAEERERKARADAWPIVQALNAAISRTDENHPAWKHLQRAVSEWQRYKHG